jgi:hypothetical protein
VSSAPGAGAAAEPVSVQEAVEAAADRQLLHAKRPLGRPGGRVQVAVREEAGERGGVGGTSPVLTITSGAVLTRSVVSAAPRL